MARLSEVANWIGMGKAVSNYCNNCVTCQRTKALATPPAPLQPIIASRPWQLETVDILKIPMSLKGSQYVYPGSARLLF